MKGQAAVEYLATYGFALVVIVVVLAILMSIFGSYTSIQQCNADSGFSCGDINPVVQAVDSNNNINIIFRLMNGNQQSVKIKKVMCVRGNPTSPLDDEHKWVSVNRNIPPGAYLDISNVPCYTVSGERAQLSPGTNFMGKIFVKYSFTSDFSNVERLAVVKVAQRVAK